MPSETPTISKVNQWLSAGKFIFGGIIVTLVSTYSVAQKVADVDNTLASHERVLNKLIQNKNEVTEDVNSIKSDIATIKNDLTHITEYIKDSDRTEEEYNKTLRRIESLLAKKESRIAQGN